MPSLSDYNKPNYRSILVSQEKLYSDLNLTMPIHPNKKDIIPLTDIDAVKNSLKNLVLTNIGEKLFRPTIGGDVTRYLFENVNVFTAIAIQQQIKSVINVYEPRVEDVTVQVTDNSDSNAYDVTIGFKLANNILTGEVEFALERLR